MHLPPVFLPVSLRNLRLITIIAAAASTAAIRADAASIVVPNGSFESPNIVFADVTVDSWQKIETMPPQVALFDNTPAGSEDHIINADGQQVAFIFSGFQIGIIQQLTSPQARFEIGQSYTFTLAAGGGGGGMPQGAKLDLQLYYLDAGNNRITIATTQIVYDPQLDPPPINQLFDYSVTTGPVTAQQPWAGRQIGLAVLANSAAGGYWDVDNARLNVVPEPGAATLLLCAGAMLCGWRRQRRA